MRKWRCEIFKLLFLENDAIKFVQIRPREMTASPGIGDTVLKKNTKEF